ncbi:MAG: DUF2062 domain-containing protein [Candidatus Puniceispirillum sp.]|nr:DUF2062 domain-containing protein [Candidatus Puniceispirillum sp.]MBL6775475.1 DUF2062 domain-containing protein [Candidatus Puniceispirillum sp.]
MRAFIWPERGFRRLFSYLFQRIIRLPGSPASIASGFAAGVAASFTPFLGLHFILAAALAMLLRGNVLASAIGTFFGNPWTFILIWLADYEVGLGIIHSLNYGADLHVLSIEELGDIMGNALKFMSFSGAISWAEMSRDLEQVFMPLLIGGTVLGAVAGLVSFLITLWVVKGWRLHRARRLEKAAARAALARKDHVAR